LVLPCRHEQHREEDKMNQGEDDAFNLDHSLPRNCYLKRKSMV
jgi:hypothetical protein